MKQLSSFENFAIFSFMAQILQPLREYMKTLDIVHYGDGYYRHTIYGIGPYIADYPEQVLLACIVQGWCPK